MPPVLVRKAAYESPALRALIFEMLEAAGGEEIHAGSRVLIKPNLLAPATPPQAILTHPRIVRFAAEYVLEKGARPLIADSPAIGSFEKILRMSGIRDALQGLDCECRPFEHSLRVDIGGPFGAIAIAEEALRADVIVNLAKLKTHSQMLLTLAVKNLFGCIIGYRKPEWHLRAGSDPQTFARLLVRICRTLRPSVNLIDGILALEGDGPGRGGCPGRSVASSPGAILLPLILPSAGCSTSIPDRSRSSGPPRRRRAPWPNRRSTESSRRSMVFASLP